MKRDKMEPEEMKMSSADDNTSSSTSRTASSSPLILHDVLGSATAGIVSRIFTHPLDTVKARLQTTKTTFHGPLDALVRTYRHEGLRALYGGFGAVFWAGTPATVVYLTSYSYFRDTLSTIALQIPGGSGPSSSAEEGNKSYHSQGQEFAVHFMSGMLAEAVCCVIYVPVDVVKERLQIQQQRNVQSNSNYQYSGSFDALRQIIKTEGIRGIYKGYGATLASFGPFSALYFMFYEQCKALAREYINRQNNDIGKNMTPPIKDGDLPLFHLVACSSGAGALASWLTSPLDMAKLRLQVQRGQQAATTKGSSNNQTTVLQHRSMLDCLRSAYREGGVNGLFRGAGARVIHFVPATTITMTGYEKFRAFYADALV
jgi:hypothetical protein